MKINNLPEYARNCKYIVVRLVDNEVWFWGAYENLEKAYQSANERNGIVIVKEPFMNKPCCVSSKVCEHDKQKMLENIREEMIELRNKQNVGVLECLDIIDKYRTESESK